MIYNHNKDNKHILYRFAISLSYMSGKQKFKISYSPTDFIHIWSIESQSWGSKAAFVSIFLPSRPSQVYHFFDNITKLKNIRDLILFKLILQTRTQFGV